MARDLVRPLAVVLLFCLLALPLSCKQGAEKPAVKGAEGTASTKSEDEYSPPAKELPTYKGDLGTIRKKGVLRVIIRTQPNKYIAREGNPFDMEEALAEQFAKDLGVSVEFVTPPTHDMMIPWLLEGKGDLIAASLTITPERLKEIAFSKPIEQVDEMLVVRKDNDSIKKPEDLSGQKVWVRQSSSYFETLMGLQQKIKEKAGQGLIISVVPEDVQTEEIIHRVAEGQYDMAVADSNLLDVILTYEDRVKGAFPVNEEKKQLAWGMRKEDVELKKAVDSFIFEQKLTSHRDRTDVSDLGPDKKSLRVLTRNNAVTYNIYRGNQIGYEYEMIRWFAKEHNLRVEMAIPPSRADLIPWLVDGKGDVVCAFMTITDKRKEKVDFTIPYLYATEQVVVRKGDDSIKKPEDLAGKTVYVRKSSSYWDTLKKLSEKVGGINIEPLAEDLETEEILQMVAKGEVPITVADSYLVDLELTYGSDIQVACDLGGERPLGWAVRKNNPKLLAALNEFIKKNYRGLKYNVIKNKYFKNDKRIKSILAVRAEAGRLSPYDDMVKRYAEKFDFDWRLMTSQMYQESRFDPNAKSWVGALGLFQIMPRTAASLDVGDVREPEAGIHGGQKYMRHLVDQWPHKIKLKDRIRFSLASYNAGRGHVLDARRLAKDQGLNPDKWFGNVEKGMLLLSKPKFAKKARYGYCRGQEPVKYVSEIQSRYEAYLDIVPDEAPKAGGAPKAAPAKPDAASPPEKKAVEK